MDKEHYKKLIQEVSPLGRIFRSLLSQMCRNLKLASIQWYVDAEKWFGLLPTHPWVFRTKHRADTNGEKGLLLLTLSLPAPGKSRFPSQTQESWLASYWSGDKREGRRRNRAWRVGGENGTARNVQQLPGVGQGTTRPARDTRVTLG